ncbi:MAG: aminotransferase class I/II-fold pyridoxal phosphate-dependent enzyme [Candidatus Aminicenantes bacterium]|nr:aminotransferase class I/II-fold pyridoxal phosphate-dependent enzyme [Candidatus Aminicenantes bacterium]
MSYKGISDFRSDTVTRPTEEMKKAMYDAELGDDVLGDDPTVIRLQELAAEKLGKEAAIFVPSGTMGNTIAMKLAVGEGKAVLMEEKCHIFHFEAANISRIAGSLPRTLSSNRGEIPIELLKENIYTTLRDHIPETTAITLENTHNIWGGAILSLDYLKNVSELAKKNNLFMHLDGARVFNAAVAQKIDVKEITRYFDSIMFCLSKALSAPVGSILAGPKDFIKEARLIRKSLGGGMRQVGMLAAAGIVALDKMVHRLAEDHVRAKKLAEQIIDVPGIHVDLEEVETNFVMIETESMEAASFLEQLAEKKVWALPLSRDISRFVVHKDIDDGDIEQAARAIKEVMSR